MTKLKDCCTIIAGQSPESKYYNTEGIGLPFFQGKADFGELYPTIRVYCSQPTKIAEKDDILLSVRAPVGPTNLAPCKVCIGRGLTAIRPSEVLLTRYVLLFFRYFEAQLASKGTGTTFKAITQDVVKNLEIPIPSISDQKRIVARIEELFSQLDAGVEMLKKTKAQFAVYRQAVLKEAFTELTEKKPIREMSSIVTSGSRGWAQYYADNGARFIRITDLTRDGIQLKNDSIQYVALPDKAEGKRSRLICGDVLVSITADLGSIALIPENVDEAYINQHIAMIRFNNPSQGEFMAWYLRSEWGQKDLLKNKRGGGKLGLGLDDIRDTPVPKVSDETARQTIAFIDDRLSVCNSIEHTVNTALQQAEAMRQSILKDAFEGGI
ncbi:MAG: restriction endonuclease subunit S [Clostridia bacterium]|nr:restriction endonuclease subunit S [Clostridia bacterium]